MPLAIALILFIIVILSVKFGMNIGFQEGYGEAYMDWLHYGKFRDLKNLRPRSRKHKYPPLSNIPSRKHCEVLDKE